MALWGSETGSTGDQTGAEIKALYEAEPDTNAFTDAEKTKLAGVNVDEYVKKTDYIYGIRWNRVSDIMERYVAVGSGTLDQVDFPIQKQMVRGLLTSSGSFTLLDPDDSSKLASGGDAVLDGSAGQLMVRIPKFHACVHTEDEYKYLLISESSFSFRGSDSFIPQAFGDDDYRYIGAFQGVAATDSVSSDLISAVKDTSGYTSNLYPNPFSNRTRAQFRAQMQDGFFQFSWGLYEVIWMLFLTELKTWNSQAVLPGYTEASSFNYAYTRKAGRTLGLGNFSGSILASLTGLDADLASAGVAASEYVANSYRGIENLFGNVWVFLDGINIDNTNGTCHVYVCNDPNNFADDTAINYTNTGHAPGFGSNSNYIKDTVWDPPHCVFYPSIIGVGASSGTFITDYNYNSAGGWRVLAAGGDLSNGAYAGLGCLAVNRASSYSASGLSARSAA